MIAVKIEVAVVLIGKANNTTARGAGGVGDSSLHQID